MNYKLLKMQVKLYALIVLATTIKHFVIPVLKATAASIHATLSLPQNIANAIEDYKESVRLESQLDAALTDHGFLNRAMLGITPADEQKIADFMKESK